MRITSEYLVLGATEGTGYAFSLLLMDKQIPFTIFAEDSDKVPAIFKTCKYVDVIVGRVDDLLLMERTLNDKQYIFLGNDYTLSEWKKQAVKLFRSIITAVSSGRPTLVYPGTILQFTATMSITERSTPHPVCSRGILEVKLEDMLLEAVVEKKCKVLIVRFPELYGPGICKTDIAAVFSAVVKGKKPSYPVNIEIPRQYAYSADAAEVTFRMLEQQDKDFFSVFNYAGHTYSSVRSFVKQIQLEAGLKQGMNVLSKRKIQLLSLFSYAWGEMNERTHFFEQSFLIDDFHSKKLIPDFVPTASGEAINHTLQWFRNRGHKFNA